jgi:hypothetical protein
MVTECCGLHSRIVMRSSRNLRGATSPRRKVCHIHSYRNAQLSPYQSCLQGDSWHYYEAHSDPLVVRNQSCISKTCNGGLGSRKREKNDSGAVTNFIALGTCPRNRFMCFLFLVRELTAKNKRNCHAAHNPSHSQADVP